MLHNLITLFFAGVAGSSLFVIFSVLKRHADDLDFLMESYNESKARQKELAQPEKSLDCN